jgi:hypothetical protein
MDSAKGGRYCGACGTHYPPQETSMVMTREEFARRWDSDASGGGISMDEVAECAQAWGLFAVPRIHPPHQVLDAVVKESGATT